ncbi:MAG: hypothetical protein KDA44_02155 [Planctomycetales bacterium]|nr:hypothetical protein [Planctomycetales bacterium]
MSGYSTWFRTQSSAFLVLMVLAIAAQSRAASISYPPQGPVPPGIAFTNIVESSGTDAVPLYGTPSATATGMSFLPTPAFQSNSSGGGADITDGQLNYTMTALPGSGGIPLITFSESGSYLLTGVGAGTSASAGATLRATIVEVNGAAIAPITLAPVSASVAYSLPADTTGSWGLSLSIDVVAGLAGYGYGMGDIATKANVVIDNSLSTGSTPTSTAQILKSNLDVFVTPEPGSMALCGVVFAAAGLGRVVRRRNRR